MINGHQTDAPIQSTLQKVDLQIYSAADCDAIHSSTVHSTNICGGVEGGYQGEENLLKIMAA
jgi:hypothetical protein